MLLASRIYYILGWVEGYLKVFSVGFVVDDRGYALHGFDADDTFEREIRLQAERSCKVVGGD